AIVAITIFSSLQTLSDRRTTVIDKLDPAVLASRDLRTSLIDQETGIRGYILTGDQKFLEPYNTGAENEKTAVLALDSYLQGRPGLSGLRNDLTNAINDWEMNSASPAIAMVRSVPNGCSTDPPSGACDPDFLFKSQQRFDMVRAELTQADDAINA